MESHITGIWSLYETHQISKTCILLTFLLVKIFRKYEYLNQRSTSSIFIQTIFLSFSGQIVLVWFCKVKVETRRQMSLGFMNKFSYQISLQRQPKLFVMCGGDDMEKFNLLHLSSCRVCQPERGTVGTNSVTTAALA